MWLITNATGDKCALGVAAAPVECRIPPGKSAKGKLPVCNCEALVREAFHGAGHNRNGKLLIRLRFKQVFMHRPGNDKPRWNINLTLPVTKELVTKATRRFWLQFVGWGGLIRWIVLSATFIVWMILGHRAMIYGLMALALIFIPILWVVGYFNFLRRAFSRYDQMQSKRISFRFTEAGLATKSDLGSAEIPWRMLDKVQRYPDVWLLFFGKRDYAYLPTAEMTEPLASYLLQQAEKHGVKTPR